MITPHKHAEVIKAWADGKAVQYRNTSSPDSYWVTVEDCAASNIAPWNFRLGEHIEWRIKPAEPITGWVNIYPGMGSSNLYSSKAVANNKAGSNRVACIQISYTPGEGL